eukprot:gene8796-18200_t
MKNPRRNRLYDLSRINKNTRIPPISEIFASHAAPAIDDKLVIELIDAAYFSSSFSTTMDAASALSALTMNPNNIDDMKQSGSLGAVVEMLHQHSFQDKNTSSDHIVNLVNTLHIITQDKQSLRRLVYHPEGPQCVLRVCMNTSGKLQEITFHILEKLLLLEDGLQILLDNKILDCLIKILVEGFEDLDHLLLILKILNFLTKDTFQLSFLIENDITVALQYLIRTDFELWRKSNVSTFINSHSKGGSRSSFSSSTTTSASKLLKTKTNNKLKLLIGQGDIKDIRFYPLVIHFLFLLIDKLNKIEISASPHHPRRSSFSEISKAAALLTPNGKNKDSNISNSKRNFSTAAPPLTTANKFNSKLNIIKSQRLALINEDNVRLDLKNNKNSSSGSNNKGNSNNNDNGHDRRTASTSSSLALSSPLLRSRPKPIKTATGTILSPLQLSNTPSASTATSPSRSTFKEHSSSTILASTSPTEVHHHQQVQQERQHNGSYQDQEVRVGVRGDSKIISIATATATATVVSSAMTMTLGLDVRCVTNIMNAYGATELLINGLFESLVPSLEHRIEALECLSMLNFRVLRYKLCTEQTLRRICHMTLHVHESFFNGVDILIEAVNLTDEEPQLVHILVVECDAIAVFVKALKFAATWGGVPMRDRMFDSLSRLCTHPDFEARIRYFDGVSVLVHEIHRRKKLRKKQDRKEKALAQEKSEAKDGEEEVLEPEDYFSEVLLTSFRRDWAASRIQAVIRARRVRRLYGKNVVLLGYSVSGLADIQGKRISYAVAAIFDHQQSEKTGLHSI